MIELKNVSKYYNNNGNVSLGLRNVNLKLSKGEIVAIVGESGSGKSTLLNVICGVDSYEDGEILFKGNETSYFNQNDMDIYRKKYVSFIYQSYNIIDSYTVLENVMIPFLIRGIDYNEARQKATDLITKVGLIHRIKHRGIKLSGGEKQRCVIARALASEAEILACDEPTGNLDSETGMQIINLIKEIAKDKLVLIVTHNYEQVENIATRTIRVSDGEIVEDTGLINSVKELETKMELENDKVKRKSLLRIALQNIIRTPKKNILSLSVLFVLSFFSLFLYLTCVSASEENQYNSYEGFNNTLHNRLIVYDKENKPIDIKDFESIKGTKISNAFYEDELKIITNSDADLYLTTTFTTYMPDDLKNFNGSSPKNENELFVVIPEANAPEYYTQLKNTLGKTITFSLIDNYTLSGYATSDEITYPLAITPKIDISKILANDCYDSGTVLDQNGDEITIERILLGQENAIYYYGRQEKQISDAKVYLAGIYEIELNEFKYKYIESENDFCVVTAKYNDSLLSDTYEYTIYADNVKAAIKTIEDLGYSYYQPAKSGYNKQSFNYILFILLIFAASVSVLLITFISYIIMAKIYSSKNKDYSILRSLGLIKKQMAKIVNYEVLIMGFAASLLAVIIAYILSIFSLEIKTMLSFNSIGFMLLYFLLMLIFNYFIARRFNKRLFKFTLNTSIKGEVE